MVAFAAGFTAIYILCLPVFEYHRRKAMTEFKYRLFPPPVLQSAAVTAAVLALPEGIAVAQHYALVPDNNAIGLMAIAVATGFV